MHRNMKLMDVRSPFAPIREHREKRKWYHVHILNGDAAREACAVK